MPAGAPSWDSANSPNGIVQSPAWHVRVKLQQGEPWPQHLSAPAAPSTSALQPCRRVDIRTQSHLPILPTASSLLGLFCHFQFASQQLPPVPRPSPQGKHAIMSAISPLITFKGGICDVDVSFPLAHPHSSRAPSNRTSPPAILQAIQGPSPAHARLHLPLHRRWYGSCLPPPPRPSSGGRDTDW